MKALRIIGNIIIGIILFALIITLSFTRSTQNFLENDLLLGVVREKIVDTIREDNDKIPDKDKEKLNDMLKDRDSADIIRMIFDNFDNYQKDKDNFKLSDADIEKIYSYALKYKDTIVKISGEKVKNMSDEEFKEIFSKENINKVANEVFSTMDEDFDVEVDEAIILYGKVTSNSMTVGFIIVIVFFILLLLLINWSLFKWMIVVGIDLVLSGFFMSIFYVGGLFIKDIINSADKIEKIVGEMNFSSYIIGGVSEIVIGVILIIIYGVIKSKKDPVFKQLDEELK